MAANRPPAGANPLAALPLCDADACAALDPEASANPVCTWSLPEPVAEVAVAMVPVAPPAPEPPEPVAAMLPEEAEEEES